MKDERCSPAFSLMTGGPFNRILCRTGLADPVTGQLRMRAILVLPLLLWLPVYLLTALSGHANVPGLSLAFLSDYNVHGRLLFALPLMLLAEMLTERSMTPVSMRFRSNGLIPAASQSRFSEILMSTNRLRQAVWPELLLVAVVYVIGIGFMWRAIWAIDAGSWYRPAAGEAWPLSLAGYWYVLVSLPVFQFVLCRWYVRLLIWFRFLWQVSGIPLALQPSHPDRRGGLGFLSTAINGFLMLAAALGAQLSGHLATEVFVFGQSLLSYKDVVLAMVLLVLAIMLGPLLVLSPQMIHAKRSGLASFGVLASHYIASFDDKWLPRSARPEPDGLLGNSDIQSLADLGGSYDMVRAMRPTPVSKEDLVSFTAMTLLPILPLMLAALPLEQIVKRLMSVLF